MSFKDLKINESMLLAERLFLNSFDYINKFKFFVLITFEIEVLIKDCLIFLRLQDVYLQVVADRLQDVYCKMFICKMYNDPLSAIFRLT